MAHLIRPPAILVRGFGVYRKIEWAHMGGHFGGKALLSRYDRLRFRFLPSRETKKPRKFEHFFTSDRNVNLRRWEKSLRSLGFRRIHGGHIPLQN